MMKSQEIHFGQVKRLQDALRQKNQNFFLKKTKTSNTLRNGDYKKVGISLDLSAFSSILEFNLEEKWIKVEPLLTFVQLCRFTLTHGLVPPVVPEFTTITIGGAVTGAALESSSHRFGQVNDTCLEYECLLGNGEVITASPHVNSDLFYGCSGSYGTLTILTAITMKLIDAKKWVNLRYDRMGGEAAAKKLLEPKIEDFAEGIVFSPNHAVVITGKMIEEPQKPIVRQNRFWSRWYVQHIHSTPYSEECMPIQDYLFRLDRGAFWIGRYVHSITTMARLLLHLGIPQPKKGTFHPSYLFRLLFGWAFSSAKLYQIWHRVPSSLSENLFFIHDFYIPSQHAQTALTDFMQTLDIFPIWLCPVKGTHTSQFLSPHFGDSQFLNMGFYGIPESNCSIPYLSALLEKKILSYGGRKMLYSFTYYDQETFSKIYLDDTYRHLRQKYHAESVFPSLYAKVTAGK